VTQEVVTTTDDGSCGRCVLCARADPVSNRLRNIEATEKAKRDMMEARKAELAARRRPEDVDYSAARCKWIGAGVFFPQSSSPLSFQPVPLSIRSTLVAVPLARRCCVPLRHVVRHLRNTAGSASRRNVGALDRSLGFETRDNAHEL
jgi:hypothetical protein